MNPRLARAVGIWAIVFVLSLIGFPLVSYIGNYLLDHGIVIVLAAIAATFLAIVEAVS